MTIRVKVVLNLGLSTLTMYVPLQNIYIRFDFM